jgi:hypothetical protein
MPPTETCMTTSKSTGYVLRHSDGCQHVHTCVHLISHQQPTQHIQLQSAGKVE